jgi:hypothetical protein
VAKKIADVFRASHCNISKMMSIVSYGHYSTQHNDTQHKDTQHNDTQHNEIQHNDTQHNDIQQVMPLSVSWVFLAKNFADVFRASHCNIFKMMSIVSYGHYNTQHNDTQHNETQRNST